MVWLVIAPATYEAGVTDKLNSAPAVIVTAAAVPVSISASDAFSVSIANADVVCVTVGFFMPDITMLTAWLADTAVPKFMVSTLLEAETVASVLPLSTAKVPVKS